MLVELCSSRWNATAAALWTPNVSMRVKILRWLLKDEFQAAFEAARECGLPDVELADQPIAATNRRLREVFCKTVIDIFAGPLGWNSIFSDIRKGFRMLGAGDGGLGPALLNPFLLAGAPASLLRGALSTPVITAYLLATIALSFSADTLELAFNAWSAPVQLLAAGSSTLFSVAATRVVLVALIQERNHVLSCAIRAACLQPSSVQAETYANQQDSWPQDSAPAAPVVAVLGLAHIHGVRELLLSEGDDNMCE